MNQKLPLETRTIIIEEELNKLSPESQRRICRHFAADLIESIIYQRQLNKFNEDLLKKIQEIIVSYDDYKVQIFYWLEFDPIHKKLVYKYYKDLT